MIEPRESAPLGDLLAERDRINAALAERLSGTLATMGAHVKRQREAKGWTQDDLASRIDLTRTSVANIEAGRQSPPWPTLCLLADLFGVALDSFREVTDGDS